MHEAYISNLYATTNSIGPFLGGKNYKTIDPFEDKQKDKSNKKQTTAKDIAFYGAFGIDARDVTGSEFKENWEELSMEEKRKLLFNK